MDRVFHELLSEGVFVHVDDIVIKGNTQEEVLALLKRALKTCCAEGLYLKFNKNDFFRSEVPLLGHLVGWDGIRPCPEKVSGGTAPQAAT